MKKEPNYQKIINGCSYIKEQLKNELPSEEYQMVIPHIDNLEHRLKVSEYYRFDGNVVMKEIKVKQLLASLGVCLTYFGISALLFKFNRNANLIIKVLSDFLAIDFAVCGFLAPFTTILYDKEKKNSLEISQLEQEEAIAEFKENIKDINPEAKQLILKYLP